MVRGWSGGAKDRREAMTGDLIDKAALWELPARAGREHLFPLIIVFAAAGGLSARLST